MNKSIFQNMLIVALTCCLIFQITYIGKNKATQEKVNSSDEIKAVEETLEIKRPKLGEYISDLLDYEYFSLVNVNIMNDSYVVKGVIKGETENIKEFFAYIRSFKDYRIRDYFIRLHEGDYQLDIALELPR